MDDKYKQEDVKNEIKKLIEKIKSDDTSKEEKLDALKLVNSLLELNIEFIKEVKKELENK